MTSLRELPIGKTATIRSVGGEGALRQHFLDMGLIPKGDVTMVKYAPMGDPMELRIHSYELTLRLADAEKIEIENIQELVEYLNDVVVYNEDNSYTEYDGQGVVFTLTMVDGTQTDIMAYNPFIVIDGIGYKTKYEPCEALNSYANELLNSGTANIILEEPPTLSVVSDETAIGAVLGTYSWQKTNIDGTAESTIADSPHPLECKDLLSPPFETTETTATLRFTEDPDTILSVQCWSDEHWGEPATNSEDVTIVGNVLTLKLGGYIYEVTAEWNTENGYGGTASYFIYLKTAD